MCVSTEDGGENVEAQGGCPVQQLKAERLSAAQLTLRRGLTVLGAVALLAVGVSVHFMVPLHVAEPSEANHTLDWINTTYTPDIIFSTVMTPVENTD